MCDITTTENPRCLPETKFLCSNLEACPHAKHVFSASVTRLCHLHTEFCRFCAKSFCSHCIAEHQEACKAKRSPEEKTPLEFVEAALGRMGL